MLINGNIYKIFVGGGISATLALLGFMGNGIVNNDRSNVIQHIEIRKEMMQGDMAVTAKIDKVQDIVTDIRLKQTEQKVLLKEIKGKL